MHRREKKTNYEALPFSDENRSNTRIWTSYESRLLTITTSRHVAQNISFERREGAVTKMVKCRAALFDEREYIYEYR